MQIREFDQFVQGLTTLTRRQREKLLGLLRPQARRDDTVALIEQAAMARLACPRCGAGQPCRHGQASGMQRWRCRACGRTFNALSGTPLARLRRKDLWLDYLDGMLDSATIRRAAIKAGVASSTTFRWRHRFLAASKDDRVSHLGGIAEADEMYVLESHKGAHKLDRPPRKRGGKASKRGISNEQVCILVARDRSGQTLDFVPGKGPVTVAQLHTHLLPRLSPDVLLVTDGHVAYRTFARQAGISHESVNVSAGERVRGAVHVQNVNSYHSRLRGWLHRFHGVATRYLGNYLGWRWALDGNRIATPAALLRAAMGLAWRDLASSAMARPQVFNN
jgi:transposase-like protein